MTEDNKLELLAAQVKKYSSLQLDLLKLRGIESIAYGGSQIFSQIISWTVLTLVLLFSGIAAAFFFSDLFNSVILGFLTSAMFFLILWLFLLLIRKKIIVERMKNKIILELSLANISPPKSHESGNKES